LRRGIRGTGLGDVVGRIVLDVGADHGSGELGQLAHDPLEHLLLVGADRGGQLRRLLVADERGELLDRGVGRDLQRLGGAGVLGVLEHLLLAAGAAQEIERGLAQRERLRDSGLGQIDDRRQRIGAAAESSARAATRSA
jgi:hypothetical protein